MQCNICQRELADDTSCPICSGRIATSTQENTPAAFSDYGEYVPYLENQSLTSATHPQAKANQVSPAPIVASTQAIHPYQEVQKRSRASSAMALLILLVLLLLIEGGGFAYFTTRLQPDRLHAQATTIANTIVTTQRMQATATSIAANAMTPSEIYQQATAGIPTINDTLDKSGDNLWFPQGNAQAQCGYANGSFHILLSVAGSYSCTAYNSSFTALAFQAQMKLINGDGGGLVFDENFSNGALQGYIFECSYQGGYVLLAIDSQQPKVLKRGYTSALIQGYNQTNVITVIAKNGHILIYSGQTFITQVFDTTYHTGQIALLGEGGTNQITNVAYNNVKVWNLSL